MRKDSYDGVRALVTGASSGIGRALTLELVRRGGVVCALARREDRLRTLVDEANEIRRKIVEKTGAPLGPKSFCVVGNVVEAEVRARALAETVERFGGLDFLVNNAGAGATLRAEETSDELARSLFDLNFFAPFELTKTAFPELLTSAASNGNPARRVRTTVVFLSSIVGLRGTPHYALYGAAKAAVATLADAWRAEASGRGVAFLTVSPGTTATEFFDVLKENRSQPRFPKHRRATPESVAAAILDAVERGKNRITPHFESRILTFLNRFFPSCVDLLMARYAGR